MVTVAVARVADTLTLARLLLAVMIAMALAADRLLLAAVMLVCGWATDTADGFFARKAPGMTKLGPWDATVDGVVGMGLMLGLVLGGFAPNGWLVAVLGLGGLLLFAGSAASGMLLQGIAYGWFLWTLSDRHTGGLILVLTAIGIVAVIHGQRVPRVLLPKFFADVARLKAIRRGSNPQG